MEAGQPEQRDPFTLPRAHSSASQRLSMSADSDDENYEEDYEDDIEDFEDDDEDLPPPTTTKPSWLDVKREVLPTPAPATAGINDLLSNFDALLAGYRDERDRPAAPVPTPSVPPPEASQSTASKLDSLLGSLEADIGDAPPPKPRAAPVVGRRGPLVASSAGSGATDPLAPPPAFAPAKPTAQRTTGAPPPRPAGANPRAAPTPPPLASGAGSGRPSGAGSKPARVKGPRVMPQMCGDERSDGQSRDGSRPPSNSSLRPAAAVDDAHTLGKLARTNALLQEQVSKAQRELARLQAGRAPSGARDPASGRDPPSSRPSTKPGAAKPAARPRALTTPDYDRDVRQLANAHKQLAYYAREHELLKRKLSRAQTMDEHLAAVEQSVEAQRKALAEATKVGRQLLMKQKEGARELGRGGKDEMSRKVAEVRSDLRVAKERVRKQGEVNEHDAQQCALMAQKCADLTAELSELESRYTEHQATVTAAAAKAASDAASKGEQAERVEAAVEQETAAMRAERSEQAAAVAKLQGQARVLRAELSRLLGAAKEKAHESRLLEIREKEEVRKQVREKEEARAKEAWKRAEAKRRAEELAATAADELAQAAAARHAAGVEGGGGGGGGGAAEASAADPPPLGVAPLPPIATEAIPDDTPKDAPQDAAQDVPQGKEATAPTADGGPKPPPSTGQPAGTGAESEMPTYYQASGRSPLSPLTPRHSHPSPHSPLTTHHSPLTTRHSPPTTHHAPLSPRTTHHPPLTTRRSPLTTHHSPL